MHQWSFEIVPEISLPPCIYLCTWSPNKLWRSNSILTYGFHKAILLHWSNLVFLYKIFCSSFIIFLWLPEFLLCFVFRFPWKISLVKSRTGVRNSGPRGWTPVLARLTSGQREAEKYRKCRLCISHFKGWHVMGIHQWTMGSPQQQTPPFLPTSVSWLLTATFL